MEICARRSICLEQITMKNQMGCEVDTKKRDQTVANQLAPGSMEVICPEPRRVVRTPYTVDSLERLCCTLKGDPPTPRKVPSLDIWSIFLSKDGPDNELDANNSQMGLFCGSPPVRADNPLIHDVQFVRQASTLASPFGNSHGAMGSSARVERAPSCGNSSFGGKPLVRIEGFSCGSSKSHCIVPALA
ncbi:hypothetical protein BVC80_9101g253 [Macleaya cordata]|uniref:Uncharacterized protein n=1 Tax=Macleaya cordata TaxID=56857 RepID=A0A200QH27_MACCD|nr:hypothetical protein BVC80_9101g253 [Macleaya cordata]